MKPLAFCLAFLAAGPAFADLALTIEVEEAEIDFETAVAFTVRFTNRGAEEVRYFQPLHVGSNTFPDVRLVRRGEKRDLTPYDAPFQTMVSRGLQGEIVVLAPGATKEYRFVRDRFLGVARQSQKADWYEPRPLPDGEYEIRAVYSQPDRRLPWNVGGFDVEMRETEGIFTGTVASAPATFRVRPPTRPHVRIGVPDRTGTEVRIVFANPSPGEHVFAGDARFVLTSKMYGTARAPAFGEPLSVAVPAGGRAERRVDLRALGWTRRGRENHPPEGLGEIVPRGICHLALEIGGGTPAGSDGIWVMVPPVPAVGMEGITVTATLDEDRVRAGAPVRLRVHLENGSSADVCVVHRLSFPRELVLRVEDATGRRRSLVSSTGRAGSFAALRSRGGEALCRIAEGLSWDRDAFEAAEGLTRKDLIWFEPEAGVSREVSLGALLATGLTPGRYRITAGYRNVESGARLGFPAGRRAATGVVWSEPVELTVE